MRGIRYPCPVEGKGVVTTKSDAWKSRVAESFAERGDAAFLGLGVSRIWTYAFFIVLVDRVEMPMAPVLEGLPLASVLFFLAAAALSFLVVALAPRLQSTFAPHAPLLVGATGTLAALCVLACNALHSNALAVTAVVLGGCVLALLRLAWGQVYGTMGRRSVGVYTASSFLLATLVNMALKLAPWALTAGVLVALPSLGALFLRRAHGRRAISQSACVAASSDASAETPSAVVVAQLAVGMFAFVFANSMVRSLMPSGFAPEWVAEWQSLLVDGVVALLFTGIFVTLRGMDPLPVYRFVLILMVAGYALCSLVPEEHQAVTLSLILVGYGLFDLLSWVVLAQVASQARMGTLRVFAWGVGMTVAGRAAGYVVGTVCANQQAAGNLTLQSLSLVMVFLLVVVCVSILPESVFVHDRPPATRHPAADPRATLETVCMRLAAAHGLTAREADVLPLLARGHSAQVISGELSIAKGTVQTHVKHIYGKLGLHNQQELIELVEKAGAEANPALDTAAQPGIVETGSLTAMRTASDTQSRAQRGTGHSADCFRRRP